MSKAVLLTLLAAASTAAYAQDAPPSTDIWLIRDGGEPVNVTDRDGYDNQPSFTFDGEKLLYTTSRDGQTDIYLYELETATSRQLTATSESEYSPTPMGDSGFSVVRVEADGKQRLWAFDRDGRSPRLLLPEVEPVGYHAWIDDGTLGLFVLGEPPTLRIADVDAGTAVVVARDIGRSLHRTAAGNIAYVDKSDGEGKWVIREHRTGSGTSDRRVETRPGREDFALTAEGDVLMADGAVIYRWSAADETWRPLHDLGDRARNVSRIAVAPDGSALAFVADR